VIKTKAGVFMAGLFRNGKVNILLFAVFSLALVSFAFFSRQILFHDTPEYIANSKILAGFIDEQIDSPHSFLYPVFISFFLKLMPSLFTITFINIFWIILDALALLYFFNSRKAFLLLAFSPLLWVVSIQISPVMPASFFVLLTYGFMKNYEKSRKVFPFIISALSCGVALALYAPIIVFVVFFMLAFFYNKPLKHSLAYILLIMPAFALELLFSYTVTGFPLYSLFRYYGTNIAVFMGYNPGTSALIGLKARSYLDLFLIAPLIFLFYRLEFSKYRKELVFLIPTIIFFVFRGGQKQLFIFTPIILVLLAPLLKKKALILNTIISIVLIVLLVHPYFQGPDRNTLVVGEMNQIREDFPSYKNVFSFELLDLYWWDPSWPRFVNIEEYDLFLNNETYYKNYVYRSPFIMNILKIAEIQASLVRNGNEFIDQPLLVLEKGNPPLPFYNLKKCYELLCVYEK